MRRRVAFAAAIAALLATGEQAGAQSERYALLIGENRGAPDEANLRYAESDAAKVRDVLIALGGFPEENVVLMQGSGAEATRRALIAINDRIRSSSADKALLFVYYSGHADARSLHLGGSELPIVELERLVRGSAAAVRLLVLDSCRSGALTRVKGGRRAEAFAIDLDDSLASEGAVFLTASSATEDAQESDEIKGSFFTHYLVSGLLGAADRNRDGRVALAEAYRYAYDGTLRASSRTLAGIQHPTFRYDLSGKGDVVLTQPGAERSRRGWLAFPRGRSYLVMEGGRDGAVVGEIAAGDRNRRLSVAPGRYFVRGRGRESLLEGSVRVTPGEQRLVLDGDLERFEYARLVRKGAGVLDRVHGPEVGGLARAAMANTDGVCLGGVGGYLWEFHSLDLSLRGGFCRSAFRNNPLEATVDAVHLEARAGRALDLPLVSVVPYLALGGALHSQSFETRGRAPSRRTLGAMLATGLTLRFEIGGGVYLFGDGAAETHLYERTGGIRPTVALGLAMGAGLRL